MFAALVGLALVISADPPKEKEKEFTDAAKKDLKTLQGAWKAVKGVKDGEEETPKMGTEDVILEFKDRALLFNGKEFLTVTALDTSTDPKCIDFKVAVDRGPLTKGAVFEGIYKLDGDTLTLALFEDGGVKRPDKFESAKGSKIIVVTLQREKK
jgi:uncharacterized protein (TIGR03067 family)